MLHAARALMVERRLLSGAARGRATPELQIAAPRISPSFSSPSTIGFLCMLLVRLACATTAGRRRAVRGGGAARDAVRAVAGVAAGGVSAAVRGAGRLRSTSTPLRSLGRSASPSRAVYRARVLAVERRIITVVWNSSRTPRAIDRAASTTPGATVSSLRRKRRAESLAAYAPLRDLEIGVHPH